MSQLLLKVCPYSILSETVKNVDVSAPAPLDLAKENLHFGGSDSKESACSSGDVDSPLGQEDSLNKGMANYSSILAWRIPWKRNLAGYSPWGCKELDRTE